MTDRNLCSWIDCTRSHEMSQDKAAHANIILHSFSYSFPPKMWLSSPSVGCSIFSQTMPQMSWFRSSGCICNTLCSRRLRTQIPTKLPTTIFLKTPTPIPIPVPAKLTTESQPKSSWPPNTDRNSNTNRSLNLQEHLHANAYIQHQPSQISHDRLHANAETHSRSSANLCQNRLNASKTCSTIALKLRRIACFDSSFAPFWYYIDVAGETHVSIDRRARTTEAAFVTTAIYC